LGNAEVSRINTLGITQMVVWSQLLPQLVQQVGLRCKTRHVLKEYNAGSKYACELAGLEDKARTVVCAALAVLAAERLTRGADDQEINVPAVEILPPDVGRVDLGDVIFDHPRPGMIQSVSGASNGVIVDGSDDPEMAAFERGGNRPRPAVEIDGCSPTAATLLLSSLGRHLISPARTIGQYESASLLHQNAQGLVAGGVWGDPCGPPDRIFRRGRRERN